MIDSGHLARIRRAGERHPRLSADVVADQIAVVDGAAEWFGDLAELHAAVAIAVDNNLRVVEEGIRRGARLSAPPDSAVTSSGPGHDTGMADRREGDPR